MYRSQLMNAGPPDPPLTPEEVARALAHLPVLHAVALCVRVARLTGAWTPQLHETARLIAMQAARGLGENGAREVSAL